MATPSFEAIFDEYGDFAWRSLARQGVAERDLPDVCQEVFMVVHRQLPGFEGRSTLRTWLYGICRHVAANHRRRAVNRRELPSEQLPEPAPALEQEPAPHAQLARRQALAMLQQALETLTEERREVFVLYEVEELPMREVAELLGCPINTAYSRLYAAREQVQAELARLRGRRVA